jgi:hypothetical protein
LWTILDGSVTREFEGTRVATTPDLASFGRTGTELHAVGADGTIYALAA